MQVVDQDASNTSVAIADATADQTAPLNTGGPQTTLVGDNRNRQSNNNVAVADADSNAAAWQGAFQHGWDGAHKKNPAHKQHPQHKKGHPQHKKEHPKHKVC